MADTDEAGDTSVLEAEIVLGDDADKFMRSDLGRVIVGMADQEADAAMAELKSAKVTDPEHLRELQNIIWRAEKFKEWLGELVDRGNQAFKTLEHEGFDHE